MKKVRITKCSNLSYWYRDSVGKTYDARTGTAEGVLVRDNDGYLNYILEGDYELVIENSFRIKSCSDSNLWYSTEVGKTFECVHQTEHAYWAGGVPDNRNAWVYHKDVEVLT